MDAARFRGALLGLAAGDALGTTVEFRPPGTFPPVTGIVGGGPFDLPAGAWTDDTSMALCLGESLLAREGFDPVDQLERYLRWYREGHWSSTGICFDIGMATRAALERFARTGEPYPGDAAPDAAGNGPLMRLAPVALAFAADPPAAVAHAGESARTTHGAPQAVDAARWFAAALVAELRGEPWATWAPGDLHPEVAAVAAGSYAEREPPAIRGAGYVVAALEAALWALHGTDSFAAGALAAVNLGDDADTTGAIYGQIAGARYGEAGIPESWRQILVRGDDIRTMADDLHRLAVRRSRPPGDAYWVDEGRLLAGPYPGAPSDEEARAKLGAFLDLGVTCFLDLTEEGEGPPLRPYAPLLRDLAAARGVKVTHQRLPIRDVDVPADWQMRAILGVLDTALAAAETVYVHCWGGIGRTGTVVGCRLVDTGVAPADVPGALARLRAGTARAHRGSPETGAQRDFVAAWATPHRLGPRFRAALALAAELHAGQRRKGTEIPYTGHLLAVAATVIEDGGSEDEAIAARLHDAAEDQGGERTLAEIRARFGDGVAGIVAECSDTFASPKPPWRERKAAYVAHLATASEGAIRVSLADKLHNARAIVRDLALSGPALWERFSAGREAQLWYYGELAAAFEARRPGVLAAELRALVGEMAAAPAA